MQAKFKTLEPERVDGMQTDCSHLELIRLYLSLNLPFSMSLSLILHDTHVFLDINATQYKISRRCASHIPAWSGGPQATGQVAFAIPQKGVYLNLITFFVFEITQICLTFFT